MYSGFSQKMFGSRRLATFAREVDAFVTISREIDDELIGVGVPQNNLTFIPNAVDTNRFAPADKQLLREGFGIEKDAPVAIFTGRLAPEKRVNHLVNVWPAVREACPGAVLLILGSGPEDSSLKQAAGEGVRFEGSIDDVVPLFASGRRVYTPFSCRGFICVDVRGYVNGISGRCNENWRRPRNHNSRGEWMAHYAR